MGTHRSGKPALPWASFDVAPAARAREAASQGAGPVLRIKVFATRGRLDRQLAAGRRCEGAELALRAAQLVDPRTQRELARHLRGVVRYADRRESQRAVISSVVIHAPAVRGARRAILELAERFERGGSVNPGGVVMARALLTDGLSPLFNPFSEQTALEAVRDVHDALDERPEIER